MTPKTFSILCICQAIVITLFTCIVVNKVTGDYFTPLAIVMMGGMIAARLWRTREQPF